MFTDNMIAPCGLDCSICDLALRGENPCPGCLGPNKNKPDFCADRCTIVHCAKRKENNYRYCDECPDYPCEPIVEIESRYTTRYPLRESARENLRMIRKSGMDSYLRHQKAEWTCENCGGTISVHTGRCNKCNKQYGAAEKAIQW
ncbi:DUF3795 domain-containing protein [Synergistes jonesii]|uniref:DUF3795 domain-containing protein n=1 Tax=Synergistes jonesii TaxID=2754 RepID=UPI0038B28123